MGRPNEPVEGEYVKGRGFRISAATLFFILGIGTLAVLILSSPMVSLPLPGFVLEADTLLRSLFLQTVWAFPAYLVFCGFFALYIDEHHPYQAIFPFTAIPYATIVGFLHLQTGPTETALAQWIERMIGVKSGSKILLVVLVLELILFLLWSMTLFGKASKRRGKNYALNGNDDSDNTSLGSQPRQLLDDIEEEKQRKRQELKLAVPDEREADPSDLRLTFPDLPDLPVLQKVQTTMFDLPEEPEEEPEQTIDEVDPSGEEQPAAAEPVKPSRDDIPMKGRLHAIRLEKPAEEPAEPTAEEPERITIGEHVVHKIPPENPEFENRKRPDIAGRLTKIQSSITESANVPDEARLATGLRALGYVFPPEDVLDTYPDISSDIDRLTRVSGEVLMKTLKEFKIDAELTGIQKGPVVTMYEILPAPGIRVQAITGLADNIALQLAASRVRIVAPIPGKQAVGIEVPNKKRSIVSFKEMLTAVDEHADYEIPIVLGKDITGESQVIDLVKTPHLLIAGATGSGKSVCVNSLICSILYRRSPKDVRLMMVDPKIVELKLYNDIPHLLTPVITESKKAIKALQYCIYEMERRYELLDHLNVRDIKTYNKRIREKEYAKEKLPYIVLVIDEFADLMTTAGKEMETYLARLAAMARAVGIHLVLATQRPSTNVITGIIKANIPSRIAFMVTSNTDSRIILDQAGAEKLLGRGDMLFSSSWDPSLSRIQGSFLSEEEVERIVEQVKLNGEPDYLEEELFWDDENFEDEDVELEESTGDPLMDEALKIVYSRNSASASYLQRRLKIGYNRAARLIEEMEERGIVGPARGSQPREILRMTDTEH